MASKIKEPQYFLSKLNNRVLNYKVYVMKPAEKMVYFTVIFGLGGLVGLIFYGGLFKSNGQPTMATTISNQVVFCLVGVLAVRYFLPTVTESLRQKRLTKLRHQFSDFAAALTNALGSGMNMNDSLNAVYKDLQSQYSDDAMIVDEVREIIAGVNNNIPVEIMLADFGTRSDIQDITNFATVFSTCYRTGGDIKSIVRRTTEIISEKIVISSEIQTAITSNKLQMNVMNVLPIIIVGMMRLLSEEFANSFSTIIGVVGLTISAVLSIAAYKVGQKITDVKG